MVYTIGAKLAKFPRTGAIFSRLFLAGPGKHYKLPASIAAAPQRHRHQAA